MAALASAPETRRPLLADFRPQRGSPFNAEPYVHRLIPALETLLNATPRERRLGQLEVRLEQRPAGARYELTLGIRGLIVVVDESRGRRQYRIDCRTPQGSRERLFASHAEGCPLGIGPVNRALAGIEAAAAEIHVFRRERAGEPVPEI